MKKKQKFYSLWLCLIIVIIFVIQSIIPNFTEMFLLNEKAITGEYWRFFTSIFIHADIAHLMYNLFALFFFGILLEKLIGSTKFLIVFFTSGIIASLISVNFYGSSLGASGAIYGLIGCLAILKPLMMVWAFGLVMPMFIAAIVWILGGVLGLFIPSNTGHIAHLSGIGVGFIIGLRLLLGSKKKKQIKHNKIEIPENYVRIWENQYMK
ncbi:rhomboid family intramembrane serine protease [Candidatus Pacearchaeota archaeon]|nr:rhomboid family intramembrane serine protease [Candidatus Pacearchaeota archaeon]